MRRHVSTNCKNVMQLVYAHDYVHAYRAYAYFVMHIFLCICVYYMSVGAYAYIICSMCILSTLCLHGICSACYMFCMQGGQEGEKST